MSKKTITVLCLMLCFAGTALYASDGMTPVPPVIQIQPLPPPVAPPLQQSPPTAAPIQPVPQGTDLGKQIEKFFKDTKDAGLLEGTSENVITLNFRDVPLADAIAALSRQAGMNITLDRDIPNNLVVTSVYSGTSVENALRSITGGMDLRYKKTPDGFLLLQWAEAYIDINKVYLYSANANPSSAFGGTAGGGGQSTQQSTSGSQGAGTSQMASIIGTQPSQYSGSQVELSDFGGYSERLVNQIKPMLSKSGVITYMPTGFLYVRDYPSRVKAVEEMFDVDNNKREEVDLKITVLRIDFNKDYESGIDWSKAFKGYQTGSPSSAAINSNFLGDLANTTANVFTFNYGNSLKNINITAQLLSSYGTVKIVHSWETRALTGSVLPFDLTQIVWYSQGSIIQVINNQTITTPQVSNTPVGLSIMLNPTKYGDKFLVNTSIRMSSVVSQQTIGDLTFPNIENNAVSVPIKLLSGEQVAISGFKVRQTTKNNVGLPILSELPILEYLFGYKTAQTQNSEIAVVISVNKKSGEQQL